MHRHRLYTWKVLAVSVSLLGCGEAIDSHAIQAKQALNTESLSVSFAGCTEFAGIGFVPWANARALVPENYELAGDGSSAIIVVRVADCSQVSVAGKPAQPARTSQIGVSVTGLDQSADINNYTVWFATNLGALHGQLAARGIDSNMDANLAYTFLPDGEGAGSLAIDASPAQAPAYQLCGTALVPTASPVPFVATWWAETAQGPVSMRTEFPEIRFSAANMTLTTCCGSGLEELLGGSSTTFALLDSYNAFEHAVLEVDLLSQ